MLTRENEETPIDKLNQSARLQRLLQASDENQSDEDKNARESTSDPDFYPMPERDSPLDNAGPIPPEYQRDPYSVEVFPLAPENGKGTKRRLQIQERVLWASAVAVSWSITIVAILKVLGIL